MGRIAGAFGVQGWLRITPWSEDPATLLDHRVWVVREAGGEAWRSVDVIDARLKPPGLVARLRGVETREEAATLRGFEVGLPRAAVRAPAPGEVYWADLVGLEVVNREAMTLGRVTEVTSNGAHPLLHVASSAQVRMIPFVRAYVDRVDVAAGRIDVDWQPDY